MTGGKYRQVYLDGIEYLSVNDDGTPSGNEDARLDARLLLEEVCGTDLQTLLIDPDRYVTPEEAVQYGDFLKRRRAHEPVAMILGRQSFMGLDFIVTHDVLIPEQDSEVLVEHALELLQNPGWLKEKHRLHAAQKLRILDLCTGSGCLIISLVHYLRQVLPDLDIEAAATDLSEAALAVAAENTKKHGFENVITLYRGDMFKALMRQESNSEDSTAENPLTENLTAKDPTTEDLPAVNPSAEFRNRFDVIISNPPYIPAAVIETLPEEVRCGEPHMALDGGEDGLDFYRIIAENAKTYLRQGGLLITEIGYDQGETVPELYRKAGMKEIRVIRDYGDNDRVVTAIA